MKRRVLFGFLFALLLATEILIGLFVRDNFVRPYVGDILVVPLIYCFVRIFTPSTPQWLFVYVFFFAVFVEVMQLFNLPELFHLKSDSVIAIIMGSTFSPGDILCYAVGAGLCAALEMAVIRYERRKND